MNNIKVLDCTLRDGGYYNNWNFSTELVEEYLNTMSSIGIEIIEIGLRTLKNNSFKGALAFTTDPYLESLSIPANLSLGVMINASEIRNESLEESLEKLFPKHAKDSLVSVVRIACHHYEFIDVLPASKWLNERGYSVGFNIMQISDRTKEELALLGSEASNWPIEVLYFADSMGSLDKKNISDIISWIRINWKGEIGIHAHDNMGQAIKNTLEAANNGATWLDSTVTGMGRGPGNSQTEYLITEVCELNNKPCNIVPLLELMQKYFSKMQLQYGWGTNVYYYMAGKYGIHPTFIQNMLTDTRYNPEDILATINYLKSGGGKKFSFDVLNSARDFYTGNPKGAWNPKSLIDNQEVLILGAGPELHSHSKAIERYIIKNNPIVIALNTKSIIDSSLITFRVASHPIRLLTDCEQYNSFKQPVAVPFSMLPKSLGCSLNSDNVFDFGINIKSDVFEFHDNYCIVPSPLVIVYALAIVTQGNANRILLAGFDGYGADDSRTVEMQNLFTLYQSQKEAINLISITPTRYDIETKSIYAM